MDLFFSLFISCILLLILLVIGYIAWKKLSINTKSISNLLIYIITPFVIFDWIYKVQLNTQTISIPIIIFIFACLISIIGYLLGNKFRNDSRKNILALSAGKWNFLYFWLPLASLLLWENSLPLRILMTMWFILYENTFGMYITAKWKFSMIDSIKKIVEMPNIWAFILWIVINLSWLKLPDIYNTNIIYFKGTIIVLWSILIWIALSDITKLKINWRFTISTFILKFLVWPLVTLSIIYLDKNFFQFYNNMIYNILFIVSLVPIGVNNIAIAKIFDLNTDDISVVILLSTLFAFVYIPLTISIIWLF